MKLVDKLRDSDIRKGDWVRFFYDNRLVIGEVKYLYTEASDCGYLATDKGTISVKSVLEVRHPAEGEN